jgi:hypothetical protein
MKRAASVLRTWGMMYGVAAMLALLPVIASFLGNRYQVSVSDLGVPIVLALVIAAIVTVVLAPLWRRDRIAGYVAMVLSTLVLSSNFEDRANQLAPVMKAFQPVPGLENTPLLPLLVMIALFALAWWAGRLCSRVVAWLDWNVRDVAGGLFIAVAATFVFLSLRLVTDLAMEWPQFFYHPPAISGVPNAAGQTAAKPDIYYIVLDRYASQSVLQNQFGYDNSAFMNDLRDLGYEVNPDAHNNYPYTTMSIASTMQANYLNDIVGNYSGSSRQTVVPFNESVRQSPVAAKLKQLGYTYDLVGNWYETSNRSELADQEDVLAGKLTVLGHTMIMDNFSKITLMSSPFAKIMQTRITIGNFKVLWYENLGDVEQLKYQLSALHRLAQAPAGGRFIYAHILVPHEPYNFNADGSINANNADDNVGKPLKQKYVDQVKYISGEARSLLKQINQRSDGQAVVVLQADEGPYPFQLADDQEFDEQQVNNELQAGDMRKWSDSAIKMKMGNLAAYHVPKADWGQDRPAADSVNIFRLIFNRYFSGAIPYLPDCYYVYPNGRERPFGFASVTARLTGQPEDARCRPDGTANP